jgi:hypothetical protein
VDRFTSAGSICAVIKTAAEDTAAACSAALRRLFCTERICRVAPAQIATTPTFVRTSWAASDRDRHQRSSARRDAARVEFIRGG